MRQRRNEDRGTGTGRIVIGAFLLVASVLQIVVAPAVISAAHGDAAAIAFRLIVVAVLLGSGIWLLTSGLRRRSSRHE